MEISSAVEFFKLMADETRLKLIGLLAQQERSVGELAEILELREPTISHHLSRLSATGLVGMRPDGTTRRYRLKSDVLHQWSRELLSEESLAAMSLESGAEKWEDKVLRTYLQSGSLAKIPDSRKKRDVVLRWLVTQFEEGRRYPEREVNEIIGQFHPDFATLRRELIGLRVMEREGGVYWRI